MGPGGERLADALAHRHRLPAFGHDAGEARHDEELECVADLLHLHAFHSWHAAHPLRSGQLRARLRAVLHRQLVLRLSLHRAGGLHLHLHSAARSPQVRPQDRVARLARVELPLQQPHLSRRLLHHPLGHALPRSQRVCARQQGHRRRTVVQPHRRTHRPWSAGADGSGTAAGMALRRRCAPSAATSFCPPSRPSPPQSRCSPSANVRGRIKARSTPSLPSPSPPASSPPSHPSFCAALMC